jgi:hypothetical protein
MTPTSYLRWFYGYRVNYERILQQWWGVSEGGQVCPPESTRGEWRNVIDEIEFKPL